MRKVHHSNLECFLSLTTPTVLPRSLPKACLWDFNADWASPGKDMVEYFNLGNLWDCYNEWSAYGLGAPIITCGERVVQYYTPYLSAIQIYTTKDNSPSHVNDDCYGEFESNSWTSESAKLSRSSSSSSDKIWDMEDLSIGLDDHWSSRDRRGDLYFEYFEVDGPFGRIPLKDKIDALSLEYPGLKEFNSIDLSPVSWMAVAWYPIYHIPARRNTKELYASFLTYHTLSLPFQVFQEAQVWEEIVQVIRSHSHVLRLTRPWKSTWTVISALLKLERRKRHTRSATAFLLLHLGWPLIECSGRFG